MVDRLQGHATGEGAIADHGYAFEILAAAIPCQGHPQGSRDGGAGMAGAEMIKAALAPLEVARHPILLAQAVKIFVSTSHQLVGIGLVTHIPNHLVAFEVEGLVEGKGELHHPQPWAEMAAAGAHHLQMALPDLAGNRFELSRAQAVQLIRMTELAEMHAQPWRCSAI